MSSGIILDRKNHSLWIKIIVIWWLLAKDSRTILYSISNQNRKARLSVSRLLDRQAKTKWKTLDKDELTILVLVVTTKSVENTDKPTVHH